MCRHIVIFFLVISFLLSGISTSDAKEDYARETGKGCVFCHQERTGGPLKSTGFAYIRNGYHDPISERVLTKAESLQSPFHKTLRFIVGYIHLLAAVIFFGAIFYIHIFIKPTRLIGGIPKYERILGVSCMITLTLTGLYLTWVRIDKWEQFVNNTFGLMLFIKLLLFALMVSIAMTAITIIHRRMRKEAKPLAPVTPDRITSETLRRFDGNEGKRAYIAYETSIYDVTESEKWKNGQHFRKHPVGTDLTEAFKGAPHGTEVFEKVTYVGELVKDDAPAAARPAHRIFAVMAYINLVIIFLILACISVWRWGFPIRLLPEKQKDVVVGKTCLQCHRVKKPALYRDWQTSVHARVGVDCYDCHKAGDDKTLMSKAHLKNSTAQISIVVSPVRCAGCHPTEAAQYEKSKHANTHEIIWQVDHWLNDGMNNDVERTTGCYACHGTVVKVIDGRPVPGIWPNVGVGRINPDGSKGSCSSCHTRHRFSIVEARKPEACDQCHLGPDHPQIEIYNESKHGTIYHAEGNSWTWDPDDKNWEAGRDFRAPTCAVCHISTAGKVAKTHDVTERLSWETQAPLTVRPRNFTPFPAKTDWQGEREKMKTVCLQCHSHTWTDDHFTNLENVVRNYNDLYYRPMKKLIDSLYDAKLLSRKKYFDEELEWEFYELWHHEGRRARMGAAMMAPDYAWWHGFYELKHRYTTIKKTADKLRKTGTVHI